MLETLFLVSLSAAAQLGCNNPGGTVYSPYINDSCNTCACSEAGVLGECTDRNCTETVTQPCICTNENGESRQCDETDEVCGSDGLTYSSACALNKAANVTQVFDKPCELTCTVEDDGEKKIVGIGWVQSHDVNDPESWCTQCSCILGKDATATMQCTLNSTCASKVSDREQLMNDCERCSDENQPVCGDGTSYVNPCKARCAGSWTIRPGKCDDFDAQNDTAIIWREPPPNAQRAVFLFFTILCCCYCLLRPRKIAKQESDTAEDLEKGEEDQAINANVVKFGDSQISKRNSR